MGKEKEKDNVPRVSDHATQSHTHISDRVVFVQQFDVLFYLVFGYGEEVGGCCELGFCLGVRRRRNCE